LPWSASRNEPTSLAPALAYGELKRVELAMALAQAPAPAAHDEPTAGMAPEERAALMTLAAGLARSDISRCCSPSTT